MLWLLIRLHAEANDNISGWTEFNISTRNKVAVSQDVIGYLPTINGPASNISTVYEVLQSNKIGASLFLKSIVIVFDQALYAKATEIMWKRSEKFRNIAQEWVCSTLYAHCSSRCSTSSESASKMQGSLTCALNQG